MRICILTQPLHNNYGGLLQAYALQKVLKEMGHEVWTEDRKPNKLSFSRSLKKMVRTVLERVPFQKRFVRCWHLSQTQDKYISQNTNKFVKKYISTTCPVDSTNKFKLKGYNFDAYVVGSDQVWRPVYSYGLENYFLDFTVGQHLKRVAYAASFGTDKWELSDDQTEICSTLIKNFDAVSVREDSAVELCRKYLRAKVEHVLDPTMLLAKDDYVNLAAVEDECASEGDLFYYILDKNKNKLDIIDFISGNCHLKPFTTMPVLGITEENAKTDLDGCVYPAVTRWIRSYIDAKMVVTDSFHGCVFSIIFNKPFWVIGNKARGQSRFESLLRMYNLEDRMIQPGEINKIDVNLPIDWIRVNRIHKEWQTKSMLFLSQALK